MIDRVKLDEIILKNDTNDWWQPELFIKNTKHLLPPSLTVVSDPPIYEQNYNCFLYAFGLHTDATILKETKGFIYDTLVKKLIAKNELAKTNAPKPGDYIIYQDLKNYPDALTHIGVLQSDGAIISKWSWGPLIKHALWDVPASYGDNVSYLKHVTPKQARKLFSAYREFNTHPNPAD